MLTSATLNNAESIADMLADEGLVVQPKSGTPVDTLNAALRYMTLDEARDVKVIIAQAASENNGDDPHNVELNAIARIITKKLGGLHRLARGVINDLIRDIAKDAYEAKSELMARKPIDLKIIPAMPVDFYDNAKLESIVSRLGTPKGTIKTKISEEELGEISDFITPDSFIQCAKLGDEEIDKAVAEFANSNRFGVQGLFRDTNSRAGSIIDSYKRVDDLAAMLFMRGLLNGKLPDYAIEERGTRIRLVITDALRAHAEAMVERVNFITRHEVAGDILIGIKDSEVHVNHVRYMEWIKSGGSTEAIMASFVANGRSAHAFKLATVRTQEFVDLYERQNRTTKNISKAKVNAQVEEIALRVLGQWIANNDRLELDAKVEKNAALNNFIKTSPYLGVREVHEWARQLVCRVVAPNTEVYALLNNMEIYMEDNPEATVQQGAIQASSFVIASWIADQLEVTKVSGDRFRLGSSETAAIY